MDETIDRLGIEQRRADLVSEVAEARQAYEAGDVRRGAVDDLLEQLSTGGTTNPGRLTTIVRERSERE